MAHKTSSSSISAATGATPPSAAGSPDRAGKTRRDTVVDRRLGIDRRDLASATSSIDDDDGDDSSDDATPSHSTGGTLQTNLERRRGPGRRRTDFMKAAEEGDMTQEQFLFVMAIDAFKRVNGKTFPTWTDVLEVIRKLGYRKTLKSELSLGGRAEDWIEAPDAPAGVFKEATNDQE